jgi:hypothetical protein
MMMKQKFLHTQLGKKLRVQRRFLALWPQLARLGWQRSVEASFPVDRNGNALPWFTYPALFFLQKRIVPEMHVFEYGCGGSTLWWSQRVARVISCEHDLEWLHLIKERAPANVRFIHRALTPEGSYTGAILEYPAQFDIVVIDGRQRVQCAKNSLTALVERGVLIWDNTDRFRYKEGIDFLINSGFKHLDFAGDGPINAFRSCTSIFYRDHNCLGI